LNSPSNIEASSQEERILVIRFSSLGDILLTAPALRGLRARFPNAHIDFLVAEEYVSAAALLPGLNRVLTFDRRTGFRGLWALRSLLSRRYSILVDLQNSFRSTFLRFATLPTLWVKAHRYRLRRWLLIRLKLNFYREIQPVPLRYLKALETFGIGDDKRGLDLFIADDAAARARQLLERTEAAAHTTVILCPGARHATKRWPWERWASLGNLLQTAGFHVVIVGSAEDETPIMEIANSVSGARAVVGHSIGDIAVLFKNAAAVVSNDSGLMHLAAGLNTPIVALFGPTVEEFGFYPFRARAVVLEHRLTCRPCSAMGGERCPKRHFRCMLDTEPMSVLYAIQALIPTIRIPIS
jgi:lipopolysaccharide heptosyltransferase II